MPRPISAAQIAATRYQTLIERIAELTKDRSLVSEEDILHAMFVRSSFDVSKFVESYLAEFKKLDMLQREILVGLLFEVISRLTVVPESCAD